jgi:hypothetical protein
VAALCCKLQVNHLRTPDLCGPAPRRAQTKLVYAKIRQSPTDPAFVQTLSVLRQNPVLRRWWDDHAMVCAVGYKPCTWCCRTSGWGRSSPSERPVNHFCPRCSCFMTSKRIQCLNRATLPHPVCVRLFYGLHSSWTIAASSPTYGRCAMTL